MELRSGIAPRSLCSVKTTKATREHIQDCGTQQTLRRTRHSELGTFQIVYFHFVHAELQFVSFVLNVDLSWKQHVRERSPGGIDSAAPRGAAADSRSGHDSRQQPGFSVEIVQGVET